MAINPLQLPPISSVPQLNWAPLDKVGDAIVAARQQQQLADAASATTKDANGDTVPDFKAMAANLFGIGKIKEGTAAAALDLQQQQLRHGQEVSAALANLDKPPAQPGAAPGAPPPQPTAQPPGIPVRPSAPAVGGGDAKDGTSIVSIVGAAGVPDDKAGPFIVRLSQATGLDPNAPIADPAVRARVAQAVQVRTQQPTVAAPAQQQPAARAHQTTAGPLPAAPGQPPQQGLAGPLMQGPPQQGAPQPMQRPPQPPQQGLAGPLMQAPSQGATQPMPPQGQPQQGGTPSQQLMPGRGSPPTGADPETQRRVAIFTAVMSDPSLPQATRDAAKSRLENLQRSSEPTGPMKEYDLARRQGYGGSFEQYQASNEADKAYASESQKSWIKKYDTLQDAGNKAQTEIPQLNLIKQQMNDPNFYSGFGSKYNLMWKQMVAGAAQAFPSLGLNPDTAFSQESFGKVVKGNILNSLGQLKGMGQIRVAEINLAKDASAADNYSVPANKVLVEIATRMHQRASDLAGMAQDYNGGRLDAGFDKLARAYDQNHPLFSDGEIKDWHRIIVNKAPAGSASTSSTPSSSAQQFGSPADVNAAIKAGKLKSGDTYLDSNGTPRRLP
jgi:hypothetical protein